MTRPAGSRLGKHSKACALVLEGTEVKHRLLAERIETGSVVHVDWLRFTCPLRTSPTPEIDFLFPPPSYEGEGLRRYTEGTPEERRWIDLCRLVHELPNDEFSAGIQALELCRKVCTALGDDFLPSAEIKKGHDFYKYRFPIERNDHEVGWVGFLASSTSRKQRAQAKTLHVNLWGSACTFAPVDWREKVADLIDESCGKVTRIDLALDFFDGLQGGIERVKNDYQAGLCNVYGKRPSCNMVGDWCNGKGRSFYIGSKQAGKQTNFYEKGYQLFGEKDATQWLRAELRYGNKIRVLNSDMLRRPQDWFAGASDYHASLLREAEPILPPTPEAIACQKRLAEETIEAEVTRNVRWLRDTAAASIALALDNLDHDSFLEMLMGHALPRRLSRFSLSEIKQAFQNAFNRTRNGAGAGPAFAPS